MLTIVGSKVPYPRRIAIRINEKNPDKEPVVIFTNAQFIKEYALNGIGKYLAASEKGEKEKYILWPTPSCTPNQRDSILVAGPSGSGKTTYVVNYTASYKRLYPLRKILYFSAKDKDIAVDSSPWITRVPRKDWPIYIGEKKETKKRKRGETEDSKIEFPVISSMSKTLFVFDDDDEDPRGDDLRAFRLYLIKLGRSENIDVLTCSHLVSNFNKTREELNECTCIVVFPWTGVHNHMVRFFSKYLTLTDTQINKLTDRNHKCVALHLKSPITAVTESEAWIV